MGDTTITRKFAVKLDLDPSIFEDIKEMVNYFMHDLKEHVSIFPPQFFKNKGNQSVKQLYNRYKSYLKQHHLTIPFDRYLERLFRCLFQYVYFNLSNYHRRREILQDIAKSLQSHKWWENWDDISQIIKIEQVKGVKYYEINSAAEQYRNLVIKELKTNPFLSQAVMEQDFEQFLKSFSPNLDNYKKLLRTFKQQLGRYLNVTRRKLIKDPSKKGWMVDLIRQIDRGDWEKDRKKWRREQNKALKRLSAKSFLSEFSYSDELVDYNEVINRLFFPRTIRGRFTSGSVSGFEEYVRSYLNNQCIQEFVNWLAQKYSCKIKEYEKVLASTFSASYPDILKFPQFKANSIPFGMDDNRIYKIEGNEHAFRLTKNTDFISFSIEDQRYHDLITTGWTPKRGVLRLSKGKFLLCLPLTKEVPDKLESTLVAGVDLGLKEGMVVSVYDSAKKKPVEVKRTFIDQKQLAGKKDEWFLPSTHAIQPTNFKRKLFQLRYQARKFQSKRMQFKHPKKHNTRAYWYLRREEKKKWEQISAIHQELVNQFATRLVAYCRYHNIGYISFENLKWSAHSLKTKVGPFLAHWQVHWFFSQIQQKTEEIALLHGIKVTTVNAKNTSKICHKCGKLGERKGKIFSCKTDICLWQGDSDLNAARNIVQRGIKKYLQYRKYLKKKEKDKLQKLYASEDGFRSSDSSDCSEQSGPLLNENV